MPDSKGSASTIVIILILLALAAGFVWFKFYNQASLQYSDSPTISENNNQTEKPAKPRQEDVADVPAGWRSYQSDKYGFEFSYPPYLSLGAMAPNSVLGTYEEPIGGIFVGNDVWIPAKKPDALSDKIKSYFAAYYDGAFETQAEMDEYFENVEGPGAACKKENYSNTAVAIKAVTCAGEGGGAVYVLLEDSATVVFIDGYSGGYAIQSQQETPAGYQDEADFAKVLASFGFVD